MERIARQLLRLARLLVEVEGDDAGEVREAYGELVDHYGDRADTSGFSDDPEDGQFRAGILLEAAEELNGLNGMTKRSALRLINKLIDPHTKGIFRDDSWRPVHAIFKTLDRAAIPYVVESAEYGVSPTRRQMEGDRVMPDYKEWKVTVEFENNKGRKTKLYGVIMASGAGSVENPLDRYDLVAYFT